MSIISYVNCYDERINRRDMEIGTSWKPYYDKGISRDKYYLEWGYFPSVCTSGNRNPNNGLPRTSTGSRSSFSDMDNNMTEWNTINYNWFRNNINIQINYFPLFYY